MADLVNPTSRTRGRGAGVVSRRRLLHLAAAATLAAPYPAWPQSNSAPSRPVTAAFHRGRGKTHMQRTAGRPPQSECGRICELIQALRP